MYEEKYHLTDNQQDILSHPQRRGQIHVLTIDPVLAADVCERIGSDKRLQRYALICPHAADVRSGLEEIERTAQETTASRLIIFDVRRVTLPRLRKYYNAIVGYNRRDFNKLCYTICIGDGPVNLFQDGRVVDLFVPFLAAHRVDFYPAVFFFDPFLHYEPSEVPAQALDDEFVIPEALPQRLVPYFRENMRKVGPIRQFFRAVDKDDETRDRRRRLLRHMYKKRLAALFPGRAEEFKDLLSRRGIQLASEKMNLYPLYFEDWVCDLMRKARRNARPKG
ncbi:MAG: hypothetical protein FJ280_16050 [Planctomycetes bacterium]|nr:hypothetical protein [Planctomycetota bacterium]